MTRRRVAYVTAGWSGHDDRFVDAWRDAGIEVQAISIPRDLDPADAENWTALASQLREFKPDVTQAGPLGPLVEGLMRVWDGPLLATSWGFDLLHDLHLGDAPLSASVRASVAGATMLLVDSDPSRDAAVVLGIDPTRLVQFPWGVDLDRFRVTGPTARSCFGIREDEVVLLSTRRHEPIYSVMTAIDAFARTSRDHPALRLVVVGDGSETESLRTAATDFGIEERVLFVGSVENSALPEVYRAADLYVSTSLTDGTSISLLEAMACGVPAAVTDIPGNRPWAQPGAVELFAAKDAGALSDIFRRTSRRSPSSPSASAVRARVEADADWARTAAGFGRLAEQVSARSAADSHAAHGAQGGH